MTATYDEQDGTDPRYSQAAPQQPPPQYGQPYPQQPPPQPQYGQPYPQQPYGAPPQQYGYPYPPPGGYPPQDPTASWDDVPEVQGWSWVFFSFKGRLERKRFILGSLITFAVTFGMWGGLIAGADSISDGAFFSVCGVVTLVTLLMLWPTAAMAMKRFKDMDQDGQWMTVIYVLVPTVFVIGTVVQIGMFLWMCFTEGSIGPNQYGPDPIER